MHQVEPIFYGIIPDRFLCYIFLEPKYFSRYSKNKMNNSCVKCVQIQSFSGPYFPIFELNTEIYSARIEENTDYKILCIWTAGLIS